MANVFDDLIPMDAPTEVAPPPLAAPPSGGNPFADLIPKGVEAQAGPEAPAPEAKTDPFADLIPKGGEAAPAGVFRTAGAEAAKTLISLPGQALQAGAVAAGQFSDQPIQQSSLYKAGKDLQTYADKWGATDESIAANPIAAGVGSLIGGFGAAAPALLAATAGAPALLTGGLTAGAVAAMASSGAASTFNEALLKGADENTAAQAAGLNGLVAGGLGLVPLGAMLAPVRAYAPALTGWAASTLEKAVVGGVVFTSIGEGQEFLGRQIAKTFYDPDAGYTPDVTRVMSSLLGGGIIGTVTPKMLHNQRTMGVTEKAPAVDPSTQVSPSIQKMEAVAAVTGEAPKVSGPTTEVTGIANAPPPDRGFVGYHGSGARFEALDPTKVGTGEGAASFGHAEVYVGENPGTGRQYQNERGGWFYDNQPYDATNPDHRAAMLLKQSGSVDAAIQAAEQGTAQGTIGKSYEAAAAIDKAAWDVLESGKPLGALEHRGFFYTMKVNRPKEDFIDWAAPANDPSQPAGLRKAYEKAGLDIMGTTTGQDAYEQLGLRLGSKEAASNALSEAGVAGNRYLDALSRTAGDRIAMLEGFVLDRNNQLAVPGYQETFPQASELARTQRDRYQAEIDGLRSGAALTYNAAVFKAHDVDVTHRNGEPLKPVEQKAIRQVQFGAPVEDNHGHAIVNGYELENIGTDEMQTFAQSTPTEPVKLTANGYVVNQKAMEAAGAPDFPSTPITEMSQPLRDTVKGLYPGGAAPPGFEATAAAVDHFWHRLRALWDIRSLRDANPDIEPLIRYTVETDHQDIMTANWQTRGEDTWKTGQKLSEKEWAATTKMIDDYVNQRYRTPEEMAAGASRAATDADIDRMATQHGVEARGKAFFKRAIGDVKAFYEEMLQNAKIQALTLGPKPQARELGRLAAIEKSLNEKPLFPVMRFGAFTLTVKGGVEGEKLYRVETLREQKQLKRKLTATLQANESIAEGKLPQSAIPFSGLPKAMLDAIETQFLAQIKENEPFRNALNQLKYENDPIRRMEGKLQRSSLIPGYSQDFLKTYASFFYHGSRQLARMKFDKSIRQAMTDLRDSVPRARDPNLRADIASFVENHYVKLRDPKADWAIPRAFMFHMALGYRAASAAQNLTQVLISTVPHMTTEFGNVTAMKNLAKASTQIRNFYSRSSTLEYTDPQMLAMGELMRTGRARAALAPEFAAASEGRSFQRGYGNKATTIWNQFLKGSSMLFELAEQTTRRSTGMATYYSALEKPDAPFVRKVLRDDPRYYADLLNRGFPPNEAVAVMAAKEMIDRTMFQYGKGYRPAYLSGPLGSTIFMFKYFTHRMLWNMYNYPASGMKTLLIMGFLGGLQGIPGFQDLNGILKAVATNFFGKDYDLEDEARKFAVDVLGMKGGKNLWDDPMTVVKGVASRGYGIPALADFIGEWAGVGKMNVLQLDRTASIALNNILPIDFGAFAGAQAAKDPGTAFAQGVSKGMGPIGSWAYNTYKAIFNIREDWESLRRWEKMAPTFLGNMSHAARVYREGAEKTQAGAAILRFDPHDTEHMSEIIAMALGYTPTRLSEQWNRIRAEAESKAFWDMRRQSLMYQFSSAVIAKDPDERKRILKSIQNFNKEIQGTDARMQAITGEMLEKSVDTRAMSVAKQEVGLPQAEKDIPLVRGIRRLFPGAEANVRKVK